MKISQVAAQLYTLREFCKTEQDLATTLRKVRAIGYEAVQVSGVAATIPAARIGALARENDLVICATHEPGKEILENPEGVVARLREMGTNATAYPFPSGIDFSSRASVDALADGLARSGRILADAGMTLCYHNHQHEFRKLDGEVILDRIYRRTPAAFLQGEIDTYWVQFGGQDPATWCRKLEGRLPLLHLKDYLVNAENQPKFAEIGNGVLDWPTIIEEAEASGCQWFIVEQDVCPGDPFDSLAQSFAYLRDVIAE